MTFTWFLSQPKPVKALQPDCHIMISCLQLRRFFAGGTSLSYLAVSQLLLRSSRCFIEGLKIPEGINKETPLCKGPSVRWEEGGGGGWGAGRRRGGDGRVGEAGGGRVAGLGLLAPRTQLQLLKRCK